MSILICDRWARFWYYNLGGKMQVKKRRTYEEQSVLVWQNKGETYQEAKRRLDDLWSRGEHPVQLQRKQSKL